MQSVSWVDPGLHNGPGFPKKSRRWVHNHSFELGRRTRRRPIGRDYAAAKDAEVGKASAEGREPIA